MMGFGKSYIESLNCDFISPKNIDDMYLYMVDSFISNDNKGSRENSYYIEKYKQFGGRNNFCIYTKRCPNVGIRFFDYDPSDHYDDKLILNNIPMFTHESPIIYSSNTIGDMIKRLGLKEESEEILKLELNQDEFDKPCAILKYLSGSDNFASQNDIERIKQFCQKLGEQEILEISNPDREIKSYYKHIDYQKEKDLSRGNYDLYSQKNTLLDEIISIREYNKNNDPVIYFVLLCRSIKI